MAARFPNLMIVGVNKCGTTSLHTWLTAHPEITSAKVKETHFLTPLVFGDSLKPLAEYTSFFPEGSSSSYVMESTPRYFQGGKKMTTFLNEHFPGIKAITVFREPVSRVFSFYEFKKRMLDIPAEMDFDAYVEKCLSSSEEEKLANRMFFGVEEGKYDQNIQAWLEDFGSERFQVLFTDYLMADSKTVLRDLANWLAVDPEGYESADEENQNQSRTIKNRGLQRFARSIYKSTESFWNRNPKLKNRLAGMYYRVNGSARKESISKATKEKLRAIYAPHNKRLAEILTKHGYSRLPDWLTSN